MRDGERDLLRHHRPGDRSLPGSLERVPADRGTVVSSLAGRSIVFRSRNRDLTESLNAIFANHVAAREGRVTRPIEVDLEVDASCQTKPRCINDGGPSAGAWRWALSANVATALPNRLYYWAILPILVRVLAAEHIMRLHAAALASRWSAVILILGDSGAGKSTTAAGWLAGGGSLVADDTLFAREIDSEFWFYGLRRPLHLPFDAVAHFAGLQALEGAREYLPGRRKVAYDCWRAYPERAITAVPGPRHVVLSSVGDRPSTWCRPASPDAVAEGLRRAAALEGGPQPVHADLMDRCLKCLHQASAWEVCWGRDALSHAEKHYGLLRELVGGHPDHRYGTGTNP